MRKKFYIYGIGVLLTFTLNISLHAQITIGKNTLSDYSLLQIEYDNTQFPNGGGVQLPRLYAADKVILQAKIGTNAEAIGLTIYNADSNKVEYWNGTEWISIPEEIVPDFDADNGLTPRAGTGADQYKTYVGLGGDLIENTTINLQGNTLNFTQQSPSLFQVKNNSGNFTTTNKRVGIGTASPTAKLHIARSASHENGFRLVDGTQGTNKVLTMQSNGNANWEDLKTYVTSHKYFRTSGSSLSANTDTKISSNITCTPGKWLIIGKMNLGQSVASGNNYTWAKIKTEGVSPQKTLAVAGVKTEVGGYRFSMPEVVYYAEFSTTTDVALYVTPPNASTMYDFGSPPSPNADYGFFFAIKLAN